MQSLCWVCASVILVPPLSGFVPLYFFSRPCQNLPAAAAAAALFLDSGACIYASLCWVPEGLLVYVSVQVLVRPLPDLIMSSFLYHSGLNSNLHGHADLVHEMED
ncbi:hypothetical protein ACQJBY_006328 [Aegilops geniculata]